MYIVKIVDKKGSSDTRYPKYLYIDEMTAMHLSQKTVGLFESVDEAESVWNQFLQKNFYVQEPEENVYVTGICATTIAREL